MTEQQVLDAISTRGRTYRSKSVASAQCGDNYEATRCEQIAVFAERGNLLILTPVAAADTIHDELRQAATSLGLLIERSE